MFSSILPFYKYRYSLCKKYQTLTFLNENLYLFTINVGSLRSIVWTNITIPLRIRLQFVNGRLLIEKMCRNRGIASA